MWGEESLPLRKRKRKRGRDCQAPFRPCQLFLPNWLDPCPTFLVSCLTETLVGVSAMRNARITHPSRPTDAAPATGGGVGVRNERIGVGARGARCLLHPLSTASQCAGGCSSGRNHRLRGWPANRLKHQKGSFRGLRPVKPRQVLIDAGPLVAIVSRLDAHHQRCVSALATLPAPLLTCWPVMAEAFWLVRHNQAAIAGLFRGFADNLWTLAPIGAKSLPWIEDFLKRYHKLGAQLVRQESPVQNHSRTGSLTALAQPPDRHRHLTGF